MFKLDDNFLTELGLGALPPAEKNKMLAHIYETLEMKVGMRLAEKMSNEQLDEFESFINKNDEAGALKWLESNFPNYKQVVAEELEKLKGEIGKVAPQIVAQAASALPPAPAGLPLAQQSPQASHQGAFPPAGPANGAHNVQSGMNSGGGLPSQPMNNTHQPPMPSQQPYHAPTSPAQPYDSGSPLPPASAGMPPMPPMSPGSPQPPAQQPYAPSQPAHHDQAQGGQQHGSTYAPPHSSDGPSASQGLPPYPPQNNGQGHHQSSPTGPSQFGPPPPLPQQPSAHDFGASSPGGPQPPPASSAQHPYPDPSDFGLPPAAPADVQSAPPASPGSHQGVSQMPSQQGFGTQTPPPGPQDMQIPPRHQSSPSQPSSPPQAHSQFGQPAAAEYSDQPGAHALHGAYGGPPQGHAADTMDPRMEPAPQIPGAPQPPNGFGQDGIMADQQPADAMTKPPVEPYQPPGQ